jgi:hypothetical protein
MKRRQRASEAVEMGQLQADFAARGRGFAIAILYSDCAVPRSNLDSIDPQQWFDAEVPEA